LNGHKTLSRQLTDSNAD